jgi:4-amino-4-deoxy-L-arabinose transferase-like glycosyltransferase
VSVATWKRLAAVAALCLLFFYGLTSTGLVGPDEPRYASIGREMARSGDWITPRLWGEAWFEKPALLYWMTAAGNLSGLGPDLAGRLPVALLSVAFLFFYHWCLKREFGGRAALFASMVLATSAAWVAFSRVGVTDLPMAALFSAAMLLGLRWLSTGKRRLLALAAFFLGLAVLAKGLVPLALSLPLFWAGRKRLRDWRHLLPLAIFFLTAAPWYILCTLRNGPAFLTEFFWRHHFDRFSSGVGLHEQPFWYYLPVLAAGLFPWSPTLFVLIRRGLYSDPGRRFLLLWLGFGFAFFSASNGKLPGYLLPLYPALAALLGIALDRMKNARWVLAASCLVLTLIPVIGDILPAALANLPSPSVLAGWDLRWAAGCVLLGACVWWLEKSGRRGAAMAVLCAASVSGVFYLSVKALPEVDRQASARPLWREVAADTTGVCVDSIHRNWRYGLNYYSITPLPECGKSRWPLRIEQAPGAPPVVKRASP